LITSDSKESQTAQGVIAFWKQAGPERWFKKDDAFDETFRQAFFALHFKAAARELEQWMDTAEGALALLILLDQYPRNAFRGTAHMFATDSLACFYAHRMVQDALDKQIPGQLRMFCYLPFEHSENEDDQKLSVQLNRDLDPKDLKWALEHARIIERFGRFPHRNELLGRVTTPDERDFLSSGGFSG